MKNPLEGISGREYELLYHIYKNGPATKKELILTLNMKPTTLNRSMAVLEKRNLICGSGEAASTGGRKPAEYDVAQDVAYAVGVDISRTYVQIAVINLKMQALSKHRFDMGPNSTPRQCADRIAERIEVMLQKLSIEKSAVLGIGVGTVGPLNRKTGVLHHPQGFSNPEWSGTVPLADMLESKTGMPCLLDNGANTALLAEYLFGKGRGRNCVAYIHCGVGIRCAVIKEDAILRTLNDREDAFAHMTVQYEGLPCVCGCRGCVESYASLESVRRGYQALSGQEITYRELFGLAAGRNADATKVLDNAAEVLGIGIANLVRLLDVELVILSGPLVANYDGFYAKCMESVRIQNIKRRIEYAKEGLFAEDVVAIGAGLMVIENSIRGGQRK